MRPAINHAIGVYIRAKYAQSRALLDRITQDPKRYQDEALQRILTANANTTYGRQHQFSSLRTVHDFRRAIPINSYEELRPYVDRVADGSDPHALTADRVEMFTKTSGTTSKPKLEPVTARPDGSQNGVSKTSGSVCSSTTTRASSRGRRSTCSTTPRNIAPSQECG
jgi:hypothetical protein